MNNEVRNEAAARAMLDFGAGREASSAGGRRNTRYVTMPSACVAQTALRLAVYLSSGFLAATVDEE